MKYNKIFAGLLTGFAALGIAAGCGSDDSESSGDGDGDGDGLGGAKSASCTEGASREGKTDCGFNDRGNYVQECVSGDWEDTDDCNDPHVCENKDKQPGDTECGKDDEGVLEQYCSNGEWHDSKTCLNDESDCTHKDTREGTTVCGHDKKGVFEQYCDAGEWHDSEKCVGESDCKNKDTQAGDTACGPNGNGNLEQYCDGGTWFDKKLCLDDDECKNDATMGGDESCGFNDKGVEELLCDDGQWEETDECVDPDLCKNGDVRGGSEECGDFGGGAFAEECVDGAWQVSTTCEHPFACEPDATREGTADDDCGHNGNGTLEEKCSDAGKWELTDVCLNDPDDCENTKTQDVTCGSSDEGTVGQTCAAGQWVDDGDCVFTCGDSVCTDPEEMCGGVNECEADCGVCAVTISVRITAEADDAEENTNDNSMDGLDSSDLELGEEGTSNPIAQIVGMRFQSVAIPAGATITDAYIEFTLDGENDETRETILSIRGEDNDSPLAFADVDGNISGRTFTDATVPWTVESDWLAADEDSLYPTPDLSTVIQEIVDRTNWGTSDQSIVLVIEGSGERTAKSADHGDSGMGPQLFVTYTTP